MRTKRSFLLSCLALLTFGLISTQAFAGTIKDSAHDFSTSNWTNRICEACHTPHSADGSVTSSPLWNHEVTQATYTVYSSGTLENTPNQPSGTSKLCLSCHDGTVAVDSFGGTGGTPGEELTGSENLGTDLSNDHPISIPYTTATSVSDGGLHDPATVNVSIGDAPLTDTISKLLVPNGTVECASCHDVHNTFAVANTKLLKVTGASSDLCLACHNK